MGEEGGERAALAEEDGLEQHAAAEGLFDEVIAFERDEAVREAGMSGEGAAKLLDARVRAAGDDGVAGGHRL